jgi:predicted dehydrogenase
MTGYSAAIIGTGRVGYQFSFGDLPDNHADAILATAGCKLVAGVNRGREKLDLFGQRYSVDALYTDYRHMLDEVRPDICIIATHPELHCEMVEGCASSPSTKAIICEKPMALSLEECDRMVKACDDANILLQINHNRRWSPEWNLGLQLLRDGVIGELNHIYCYMDGGKPSPSWRSEHEGPLLHDFTHYFDLMDMYAGKVDWLCGMAEQRMRPWAVEDFSTAMMKFKDGATGAMHSGEVTNYTENAFELRGRDGVIRFLGERVHLFESVEDDYEPDSGFQWHALALKEIDHPPAGSTYMAALGELTHALNGNGELRSDGRVGMRSLEMVMAIYQSQLEGNRPIHFPMTDRASGVEGLRAADQFIERTE